MGGRAIPAGARAVALRRAGGRCEGCGLEWPWALYAFLVDPTLPARAENLVLLCLACSDGRTGSSTPVLSKPSLRERVRRVNNARTGAAKLTAARRRRLIASRGGRCETCGATSAERQLDVHHVTGLLRGGDDSDANLMVLCFACHHHLQPCAAGCGGWAKKPATVCRHCRTLRRLEELLPGVSRDEIRARYRGA